MTRRSVHVVATDVIIVPIDCARDGFSGDMHRSRCLEEIVMAGVLRASFTNRR
jgi:hypothetical protein